eukprot:RCo055740
MEGGISSAGATAHQPDLSQRNCLPLLVQPNAWRGAAVETLCERPLTEQHALIEGAVGALQAVPGPQLAAREHRAPLTPREGSPHLPEREGPQCFVVVHKKGVSWCQLPQGFPLLYIDPLVECRVELSGEDFQGAAVEGKLPRQLEEVVGDVDPDLVLHRLRDGAELPPGFAVLQQGGQLQGLQQSYVRVNAKHKRSLCIQVGVGLVQHLVDIPRVGHHKVLHPAPSARRLSLFQGAERLVGDHLRGPKQLHRGPQPVLPVQLGQQPHEVAQRGGIPGHHNHHLPEHCRAEQPHTAKGKVQVH